MNPIAKRVGAYAVRMLAAAFVRRVNVDKVVATFGKLVTRLETAAGQFNADREKLAAEIADLQDEIEKRAERKADLALERMRAISVAENIRKLIDG